MSTYIRWNVIFLLDQNPPSQILLLKRSPTKSFAPNMYTGIGGNLEAGESAQEGAERELAEESGLKIPIRQLAQCIVNEIKVLDYFVGVWTGDPPPCPEGELEWVSLADVLAKDIIPTTKYVLEEWQNRSWETQNQWTLHFTRTNIDDLDAPILDRRVTDGIAL